MSELVPTKLLATKLKINDSTKYLYGCFRILGIEMPSKFKALYLIYSFVISITIYLITPMAFPLYYYFIGSKEIQINEFMTSLQVGIGTCSGVFKLFNVTVNRGFLAKMEAILDKLDARIKYPEEICEAQQVIRFGKRVVLFFVGAYFTYLTVTLMLSVYMGRPPYSMYIPYLNWRESKWDFAIVAAIQYYLTNINSIVHVASDTYAIIFIQILRSYFKILIMRVQRIGTDIKSTQEDNTHGLVQCIGDHQKIIELTDTLKPVMSVTYFIQFISTTLSLGATLINISISNDRSTLITSASFMVALIMQVLPVCYFVNSLVAESDRLSGAIFYTNCLDQSREYRQLCLFFMHRSQTKLTFSACKLFPISVDSFLVIIKYSFSVYTLLNNLDFKKRFNSTYLSNLDS